MAKYETIQYGSPGEAARKLRRKRSYHMPADPGVQTQAAQSTRSLTVSGGSQGPSGLTDYEPSQETRAAREELDRVAGSRPGDYESPYEEDLEALYDQIMNRGDFSYDPGTDPLYRAYRDQYRTQGRMAMEDTMARAAGLTGGYGSTYSQTAGQQAYNGYLTEFGSMAQDLYRMALEQHNSRGRDLLDRYGMLRDLENESYDRYQEGYDRWLEEYYEALDRYDQERELDYERYQEMLKYWQETSQHGSGSGSSSGSTSSGKSGGSSGRSGGSSSGSGSGQEDAPDYGAIKALARQYMEEGGSDPLGSDGMRRWMEAQGLTGRSAELFLTALELLGYETDGGSSGSGSSGSGSGGRVIRDDRANYLN